MIRDRVIWIVVSLLLASMAASLWGDQAIVGAFGAGAMALYAGIAAVRGRCVGAACAMPLPFQRKNDDASDG